MSDKEFHTPRQDYIGHFKTPLPYSTPKSYESSKEVFATPLTKGDFASDSDESTASSCANGGPGSGDSGELTIVAEFDDLMRCLRHRRNSDVENVFLATVEKMKDMDMHWQAAMQECQRLQAALDEKMQACSDLEGKLNLARRLLDQQKRHTKRAEEERRLLEEQMAEVRELVFKDKRTHIPDDAKEKLSFLQTNGHRNTEFDGNWAAGQPQLSTIQEVNTTGSLLSDFSYSRSEDDLDTSLLQTAKTWKKHRPSTAHAEPAPKKRKSGDAKVVEISTTETVRATTTLTVPKEGPITATSIIESVPTEVEIKPRTSGCEDKFRPSAPPVDTIFDLWQNNADNNRNSKGPNVRLHTFQTKTVVMPDNCTVCEKRMGFGKSVAKCAVCRTTCHLECKIHAPLPCIPVVNTPTLQKGVLGYIGDYTPTVRPMIPSLIVHCVNEIESRGLNEVGLYRVPGSEREVRSLREKFLKQRGAPNLSQVDVNVLCGTVKDFLRSLNEPLIPRALWRDFVQVPEIKDEYQRALRLNSVISDLPQPNRDTLAFIVLHLIKVAHSPACRMPVDNLAKVFGPTIVGYSSEDLSDAAVFSETTQQAKVMECLLNLPDVIWMTHLDVQPAKPAGKLQQTPSTDSLLRTRGAGGFFTPNARTERRKQKFFPTPPSGRK